MKRFVRTCLTGLLCCLLALSSTLPAFAATGAIKDRTHQPPADSEIARVFAIDQENQTYHNLPQREWKRVRSALSIAVTPAQSENKKVPYVGGFCFEMQNGVRRIYTISTTQVLVGDTPLFATVAQRNAAEKLSRELTNTYAAIPAMLAFMEPQRITRVIAEGNGTTNNRVDAKKPFSIDFTSLANQQSILDLAAFLRKIEVNPRATQTSTLKRLPTATTDTLHLTLEFNTGTSYEIAVQDGVLHIFSNTGVKLFSYPLSIYDPRRPTFGTDVELRSLLLDLYREGGNYTSAVVFLTTPNTRERLDGAFFSIDDGGESTVTRLGQILDDIVTTTPTGRIYASKNNFLEVHAQGPNGITRFELDPDSLTAYYAEANRAGQSVPISKEDYRYVKSLLNSKDRSNRTIYFESADASLFPSSSAIYTFDSSSREPLYGALFGELFDPKAKDESYQPYTTGKAPAYTVQRYYACWADTGKITCTIAYENGIMVQNAHQKPWTPVKGTNASIYRSLQKILNSVLYSMC